MALTRVPSCFIGLQESHIFEHGHLGVQTEDALAPPLCPKRSRKSAQKSRSASKSLPEQDASFGLDYLRKQEERGRDRERKPRNTGSSKKKDVAKFCVLLTSFLLAPMVCNTGSCVQIKVGCYSKYAVCQSVPSL